MPFRTRSVAVLAMAFLLVVGHAIPSHGQTKPAPREKPAPKQERMQTPVAPQPAQLDRNGVLMLVRSTMLALHQANITGNYTVLRDLGASGFQTANTAARLAEIFANQRANRLDLSGVAVLEPQLTTLPEINQSGLLHMAGFFPSVPLQVNFELFFAPVEAQWRLMGISVNVGQSSPVAPVAKEQPTPSNPTEVSKPAKP